MKWLRMSSQSNMVNFFIKKYNLVLTARKFILSLELALKTSTQINCTKILLFKNFVFYQQKNTWRSSGKVKHTLNGGPSEMV